MTSPYKTNIDEAEKGGDTTSISQSSNGAAGTAVVVSEPTQVPSRAIGCSRLWTSKDGDKKAIAELLSVGQDYIRVRTKDGRVVKQTLESLSEADVLFVRESLTGQGLFASNDR
jgi:hypothetical protein